MYTVLWTKPNVGYEEVLPSAKRVWLRDQLVSSEPPPMVGIEFTNGDVVMYDDGNFYVMNENGSTVARYRLGLPVTPGESPISVVKSQG